MIRTRNLRRDEPNTESDQHPGTNGQFEAFVAVRHSTGLLAIVFRRSLFGHVAPPKTFAGLRPEIPLRTSPILVPCRMISTGRGRDTSRFAPPTRALETWDSLLREEAALGCSMSNVPLSLTRLLCLPKNWRILLISGMLSESPSFHPVHKRTFPTFGFRYS